MDGKRLAKIAKKWKIEQANTWMACFITLVRKLDMNITGEQIHWIRYRTWFYTKMKRKKKTLVKIEDFKTHHWQFTTKTSTISERYKDGPE